MKRDPDHRGGRTGRGFNPSVGILVYEAGQRYCLHGRWWRFNPSVGILVYEAGNVDRDAANMVGFNPSVGILVYEAFREAQWKRSGNVVSIPRSGFWSMKLSTAVAITPNVAVFQSLGRDSGL